MTSRPLQLLISAGEASGDLQGSALVTAFRELHPDVHFAGLGGKKMQAVGVETFSDIDRLGGLGLTGVLGGFFHHRDLYHLLAKEIRSGKYDAVILVHYPMFNLLLAKVCREMGVPAYFYISPQVWASRKGRIRQLRRTIDKMFVILPFEEALYRKAGVDVEFVGHPFIEQVKPTLSREKALEQFGLNGAHPVVGLLPGSRKGEIKRMLPVMVQAAERIRRELPECQFISPIANTIDPDLITRVTGQASVEIKTVSGQTYDVMHVCDYAICTSGSATLELGLMGVPTVILYRFHPVTFWSLRWLLDVPRFGLINIIAGKDVAPELLQHQANPYRVAREALSVLKDPSRGQAIRDQLLNVRATLGEPGVARRVAEGILRALQGRRDDEKVSL